MDILLCLTLLVPSCVTLSVRHISYAVLHMLTRLNSFLSKAQNNIFMAFALAVASNFCVFDQVEYSSVGIKYYV